MLHVQTIYSRFHFIPQNVVISIHSIGKATFLVKPIINNMEFLYSVHQVVQLFN